MKKPPLRLVSQDVTRHQARDPADVMAELAHKEAQHQAHLFAAMCIIDVVIVVAGAALIIYLASKT